MCGECGYCERHCDCEDAEDGHKRQRQQPVEGLELRILPARETATASAAASEEQVSPIAEQQFHSELSFGDKAIPLS